MTAALGVLLVLPGAVLAGLSIYLLTLAAASALPRRAPDPGTEAPTTRLAVLVPAHNEAQLIARCVRSLLDQTYPRDLYAVIVIADNCSDSTAERAAAAGADVMIREEPELRGKGHALRWATDALLGAPDAPEAIIVIDGDSVADPDLIRALESEFRRGHEVVQADYTILVKETSGRRVQMIAAGFLLFHRIRFTGRARLGMPANLVGNGMLFGRSVLLRHPWSAFTGVEDLEYSIQLRLAGVRPRFAPAAYVAGPGPASRGGEVRQRMRWEGGRFHVMKTRLPQLVAATMRRRDPSLLDAVLDLATPPLGLMATAIASGFILVAIAGVTGVAPLWALAPWAFALVAVPLFVLVGLRAAGAPAAVWHSLARAPLFLAWKVMTYARLAREFDVNRWDRTDRTADSAAPAAGRIDVAGVPIDLVDMAEAVDRASGVIGSGRLLHVATVNLDFVVHAQQDPNVRRILQLTGLNLADGAPVVWLGRLLGAPIPARVAGADFVPALLSALATRGARVFLLGGEGGVAAEAGNRILACHPGLVLAGTYEPPRASIEDMNSAEILAAISRAEADVLLVALGHPKQERWIDMHRDGLSVSVAVGVGCVLDVLAQRVRRAPQWMQALGLEWAYRLAQEPGRLFRRYLTNAMWLLPIALSVIRSRRSTRQLVETV